MKNKNFKKIHNLLLVFCMLGLFSICFAANGDTETKSSKNNNATTGKNTNKRMGKGFGRGFGKDSGKNQNGSCICPKCGEKKLRQRGVPCRSINCPKCNSTMVGEGNNKNINVRRGRKNNQKSQFLCVCPACGKKQSHQRGLPCSSASCPKCDSMMTRE